jgi:hypothetical protein
MTEFQNELLSVLKGIQRELIISNTKDGLKSEQVELFRLDDLCDMYLRYVNLEDENTKEEYIEKYKTTRRKYNDLRSDWNLRDIW